MQDHHLQKHLHLLHRFASDGKIEIKGSKHVWQVRIAYMSAWRRGQMAASYDVADHHMAATQLTHGTKVTWLCHVAGHSIVSGHKYLQDSLPLSRKTRRGSFNLAFLGQKHFKSQSF